MNGWLLDTNVISEWVKPKPSAKVVSFLSTTKKSGLFTSSVSIAEIRYGIEALENSMRKVELLKWLETELIKYFDDRLLQIKEDELISTFHIVNLANKKRKSVTVADALIAGITRHHKLTLVTRNTKDFVIFNIPTFNPWTGVRFNGA
jgi:toxin FitB